MRTRGVGRETGSRLTAMPEAEGIMINMSFGEDLYKVFRKKLEGDVESIDKNVGDLSFRLDNSI